MNAITVIAARELRDRSRLFIVAACMAVLPFLAVMVPAARANRPLVIASVAAFLAIAYSSALALAIGVSMVGGELAEKRFSFYLAKPIGVAAIWFGKVAAALLTVFGTAAIIAIPAWLGARSGWRELWMMGSDALAPLIVAGCVVLLFVGHGLSTIVRSRSPRVAADFVLLGLAVLATLLLARPLTLGGAFNQAGWLAIALAGVFLLALIFGPVWQLWRGRVDARRNHAALSNVVWSVVTVALLAGAGYVFWFTHPPLSALEHTYVSVQDPSGRWTCVAGPVRHRGPYFAAFLIDTAGGRERIAVPVIGAAAFSADGWTLAWMEEELLPPGRTFRLYTRRLEKGAKQVATPVSTTWPYFRLLSDDASRVVFLRNGNVEVYETATGRLLVAARMSASNIETMYFATPNLVRIIDSPQAATGMRMRELDVGRRTMVETGHLQTGVKDRGVMRSADGSRLFLRSSAGVFDARSGARLVSSPVVPRSASGATLLRGGSSIVIRDGKLYHMDTGGKIVAVIALPVVSAAVSGEVGEGKVLLASMVHEKDQMMVVDLVARRITLIVPHVHGPYPRWDDLTPQFAEDATLVANGDNGELLLWDVRTGKTRRLE
jgi:hypothetical protein